jgi:hypothetical protein
MSFNTWGFGFQLAGRRVSLERMAVAVGVRWIPPDLITGHAERKCVVMRRVYIVKEYIESKISDSMIRIELHGFGVPDQEATFCLDRLERHRYAGVEFQRVFSCEAVLFDSPLKPSSNGSGV